MQIALELSPTEAEARFAHDLGMRHVVTGGPDSPRGFLELDDLVRRVDFFADHGLCLGVIENVPLGFYDRLMLGLPGRDRQADNYCRSLEHLGQAGIPVLGYHWMALGGISTNQVRTRGGASTRHFRLADAHRAPAAALDWRGPIAPDRPVHLPDRDIPESQMWDHLAWFLERVLPVAESAGVKLAAHPDDAPVPTFLGVARILSSLDGLRRLLDLSPSPSNGLNFCQGTISEMPGVDVPAAVREFGRRGGIHFAHCRDTRGTVPEFTEVFMDDGDTDMLDVMRAYVEVGFDGLIRADHTPRIVGDNPQAHRGFAFGIGYMQGLAGIAAAGPQTAA